MCLCHLLGGVLSARGSGSLTISQLNASTDTRYAYWYSISVPLADTAMHVTGTQLYTQYTRLFIGDTILVYSRSRTQLPVRTLGRILQYTDAACGDVTELSSAHQVGHQRADEGRSSHRVVKHSS